MEKTKIVSLFAFLILFNSVASVFAVSRDEFPRLDEAIGVVAYPEAAAMAKARAGEIDNVMGMINPDNVEELAGLGWSISANPGFHMCYLGINCRDYTPETSGQPSSGGVYPPYGVREPGWPLYPLNITEFRYALHLLIGCRKTDWIAELYGFINVRLDTTIPPASVFWFNPSITPVPYDPVQAYQLLLNASFSNSTGIWIMPNGQELRKIWVMSPIEAPPSVTLTGKCVDSWNAFFGKGSDGEYYFIHAPQSLYDIIDWAFINRDHDIYFLCWGLGRNPDYLYDMFHPDVDIPDGSNSPGLNYPPLNDLLYAIKYWRWPDGTPITTAEEMREIVWEAQEMLYVLTPYIPLYSRKYHNAYAPGLQCWVESLGYGSANWFTYNWINWKGVRPGWPDPGKPSWRFHISGPLSRLNPISSTSAYDWQVLNLVLDGLLGVNPYTHEDILWAAKAWIPKGYEPWSDPEHGVQYGMKVTFKLRPGIKWQDGTPVDANTVKYNFDLLKQLEPPRYYDIWANYVTAEIPSSDTITIYINNTGLWLIYSFAGSALLMPPHIYCPNGPADWKEPYGVLTWDEVRDFKPYETPHPTFPTNLTCLIGTGPWIFKEWNTLTQTVRLVENTGYFAYNFLREDVNFDGKMDMADMSYTLRAFGATPGHPRWQFGRCDINCDNVVNELDVNLVYIKMSPGVYEDIAVTNLKASRPRVSQGYSVYVEVTVQNKGKSSQKFKVSIKFETGEVETSTIYLDSGSSKTILLAVVPRAFLFEEISRKPYGVPYGNIGNLILTGSNTFLQASTGYVKYGDFQLLGGLIELYSSGGTLIRRVELLIPPNEENTVFTAGNYGNGLYVLGATNGELLFLDENGEFGQLKVGNAPVNNVTIEGLFVHASTPDETISLKRCSMNFQLLPGYYSISAVASIVLGEVNIEDNTFIDGLIKVVLAGDVNDDNIVDMTDIGIILRAYGTTPASPKWNPNCDINNDNVVDMTDVGIALRNYGKKYP